MVRIRLPENSELATVLRSLRSPLLVVGGLSGFINILALSSSLFLMMVYDRVLPSGSGATLFGLFVIFGLAFVFHGILDATRSQMLVDIGRAFGDRLSRRVQQLQWRFALAPIPGRPRPAQDLDHIRGFMSGAGPAAFIDLPWVIFFLGVLFLMHPWLGVTTLAGIVVLGLLTWHTERSIAKNMTALEPLRIERAQVQDMGFHNAGALKGLGMTGALSERLRESDARYFDESNRISRIVSRAGGTGRIFRIFLQSAVLSVGAILVIDGKASGGIIFASSILSGRALAPIDQAIANWRGFVAARHSWTRLDAALAETPAPASKPVQLPAPARQLQVDRLTLVPAGGSRVAVADVVFEARAGDVIGVIGPSGSGKSSLLRGLAGIWPAVRGSIRLDGAALDQWTADEIGRHLGYLPQEVALLEGSVAANIGRFDPAAESGAVLAAAQQAGVHDLVVSLPDGYETEIGSGGHNLSAGQRQRIALARALYGDPFLLLLDEPNSNLDPEGEAALAAAIQKAQQRGAITVLVTHQTRILSATNKLLVLRDGKVGAWGPRDKILAALAQGAKQSSRDGGLKAVN
jgi:PrtD family type I secretion system ABC transporter